MLYRIKYGIDTYTFLVNDTNPVTLFIGMLFDITVDTEQ